MSKYLNFTLFVIVTSFANFGVSAYSLANEPQTSLSLMTASDPKDNSKSVLLLQAGGFATCLRTVPSGYANGAPYGVFRYKTFDEIRNELSASGYEVYQIVSCFYADGNVVTFYSDQDPSRKFEMSVSDYIKYVVDLASIQRFESVSVMGHSYGGWLSLQLASALAWKTDVRLLASIDPISPKQCNIQLFVQQFAGISLNRMRGIPAPVTGCQRSPEDLSTTQKLSLKGAVRRWINYYQQDFLPLHSAAMADANLNEEVRYSKSLANHSHRRIFFDPQVWAKIRSALAEAYRI
jgi:pimeloyl-ACP methyl ester carboxylesterase